MNINERFVELVRLFELVKRVFYVIVIKRLKYIVKFLEIFIFR